jgi:hypothetical protein
MSKREKLLKKWRDDPPNEEELDSIESVLTFYSIRYTKPDHIVLHDDRLNDMEEVRGGNIQIPIWKGHKVKKFYIRRLVRALEILGVYEEIEK